MAATVTSAALLATVPAHAVSGGNVTDTGAQPYPAKIDIGSDEVTCSGALLAPEWVVTSAACFAAVPSQPEAPEPGAPHTPTTATIGGLQRQVDRIVPRDDRDVALAHLARPVTSIEPAALPTTAPAQGQAVQTSGYGRTADQWVPDQPRTGEFTIGSVATGAVNLRGTAAGTSICKGDAGGPVLRDGQIIAVAGGSHQSGCLGETSERTGATAARVDNIIDWMAAQAIDLHATPATKNAINLSWTALDGAATYGVYTATTETVALIEDNELGETGETAFTHTRLPAGQARYYRVVAFDSTGAQIGVSTTVRATTPTDTRTDFNGDGMDDAAAFNGPTTSVALSEGQGFGSASRWSSQLAGNGAVPMSGDFNGDGISDVVTFNDGEVNVALSDGTAFRSRQLGHNHFGLASQETAVGDVNGDGLDDLVAFDPSGDVFVVFSEGDQFSIDVHKWHDGFATDTGSPTTGDFNGDGRDDIIVFNDGGKTHVSLSDGTRFVQTGSIWHPLFAPTGEIPAVGDFNGDGMDDIVTFLRGDTGDVYVSLSQGDHFRDDDQLWSDFFSIEDEWPGVGDFNGDGKSDVVTFTRGGEAQVYVASSDGTAFEEGTPWHGSFVAGAEVPLPSAQR